MKNCFIIHSFHTYILNILQFIYPTLPTALPHSCLLLHYAIVHPLPEYNTVLLFFLSHVSYLLEAQLQTAYFVSQDLVYPFVLNAVFLHVLQDAGICIDELVEVDFHCFLVLVVLWYFGFFVFDFPLYFIVFLIQLTQLLCAFLQQMVHLLGRYFQILFYHHFTFNQPAIVLFLVVKVSKFFLCLDTLFTDVFTPHQRLPDFHLGVVIILI